LVLAAVITPPEVLSCLIVTIPLLLLYEISIAISRFAYKKAKQAEKEFLESN
jgi:sec-independent protein translocase protein TatC